ncbi:MAG: [FeFe] hydrogenase H-cluster maturation GTPase HydF [Candidatus Spyradocola sp.]|nr:[FeFe] hydrogenase H-cluster maturation GTPase HydF [Candidatus Spyradocola sp.]
MTMNATPSGNRTHIGIFGRRNAGKSSLINALTGQKLAIVSDIKGTTTDPVSKAMELLPLGPVVLIDTPGLDDEGELGAKRIEKAMQVLRKTDIALLVADAAEGLDGADRALIERIRAMQMPYLVVYNKCDEADCPVEDAQHSACVSALTGRGIHALKERIAHLTPEGSEKKLLGDLLSPGDVVVLVVPVDESAPKGRIILPQQQALRDVLDAHATAVVCQDTDLKRTLEGLGAKPRMVVTDSQAFASVSRDTPRDVPLTSFSILMARYKGYLDAALRAMPAVEGLADGDTVLIAEGCTHHRQCNDIGTVKIPRWLRAHSGKDIAIKTCSGTEFPDDLSEFKLVIHCGGCMLNEREVLYRMREAERQGVPFINYGLLIAHMQGILERAIEVLPK